MSSLVLMENAAVNCVNWLAQRIAGQLKRTVILCGRGNNGGDGLAIARHLRVLGWPVTVVLLGPADQLSADAQANWQIFTAKNSSHCVVWDGTTESDSTIASAIRSADIVVDALLGSGAKGTPREPLSIWIALANSLNAVRVAIDIPTGLDASSGVPSPITFQAAATLTFVARKPGFNQLAAQACLGEVVVMPIGIPVELIDELIAISGTTRA